MRSNFLSHIDLQYMMHSSQTRYLSFMVCHYSLLTNQMISLKLMDHATLPCKRCQIGVQVQNLFMMFSLEEGILPTEMPSMTLPIPSSLNTMSGSMPSSSHLDVVPKFVWLIMMCWGRREGHQVEMVVGVISTSQLFTSTTLCQMDKMKLASLSQRLDSHNDHLKL